MHRKNLIRKNTFGQFVELNAPRSFIAFTCPASFFTDYEPILLMPGKQGIIPQLSYAEKKKRRKIPQLSFEKACNQKFSLAMTKRKRKRKLLFFVKIKTS